MRALPLTAVLVSTGLLLAGCQNQPEQVATAGRAAEFGRTGEGVPLDTPLFELRGTLIRKAVNRNRDGESPLVDSGGANVARQFGAYVRELPRG